MITFSLVEGAVPWYVTEECRPALEISTQSPSSRLLICGD